MDNWRAPISTQFWDQSSHGTMNPFGPPVIFPAVANGHHMDNEDKLYLSAIIHGTWLVVYSWPPLPTLTPLPPQMTLGPPSKLEAVLFGCRCHEDVADKLQPVKVFTDKYEVQACELINEEAQVAAALNRTTCNCRTTPLGDKFAALPINEDIVLYYQKLSNVAYSNADPNSCKLLFRNLPSSLEMEKAVEGMDIAKRRGDCTFMIKQE